ncbi:hypothetical protein TNCV_506311 [Trichonephila clavipes]|nr:hypothetical protein TNCV_506311 [Trichonephila clavipes]
MPVVSCSFEHRAYDNTIWLDSTPILWENIRRWSKACQLSSLYINLTRELSARWLFRVTPCHKGIIHLQTSMLSPGFEPRPYDSAATVNNYYMRWAAKYTLQANVNATPRKTRYSTTKFIL